VLVIVSWSVNAPYRPIEAGAVFKFATIGSYVEAQRQLATAVRAARRPEVDLIVGLTTEKRHCVCPLVALVSWPKKHQQ
jgi:hypothetical protein